MEKLTKLLGLHTMAIALALAVTSCDYGEENNDHQPPSGQGSLIINNNTVEDLHVYIDGIQVEDVSDYDDRAYDLAPGIHRVILDQRGGDRSHSGDVDILADRRTIMDVANDPSDSLEYDVVIIFD